MPYLERGARERVFILLLTRFGETKPFCADHTRRTGRKGYPANSCDRSGHPQRARTGRHRMADGRDLFEDQAAGPVEPAACSSWQRYKQDHKPNELVLGQSLKSPRPVATPVFRVAVGLPGSRRRASSHPRDNSIRVARPKSMESTPGKARSFRCSASKRPPVAVHLVFGISPPENAVLTDRLEVSSVRALGWVCLRNNSHASDVSSPSKKLPGRLSSAAEDDKRTVDFAFLQHWHMKTCPNTGYFYTRHRDRQSLETTGRGREIIIELCQWPRVTRLASINANEMDAVTAVKSGARTNSVSAVKGMDHESIGFCLNRPIEFPLSNYVRLPHGRLALVWHIRFAPKATEVLLRHRLSRSSRTNAAHRTPP